MSDYLTRLVDRAMGKVPEVRPIVAPLFAFGQDAASGRHPFEKNVEAIEQRPAANSTVSKPLEEDAVTSREKPPHRLGAARNDGTNELETAGLTAPAETAVTASTRKQAPVKTATNGAGSKERENNPLPEPGPAAASIGKSEKAAYSQALEPAGPAGFEIIRTVVPEQPETTVPQEPRNRMETFERASAFLQLRHKRFDKEILVEEPTVSQLLVEPGEQPGAPAAVERTVPAKSQTEAHRTRVVHRDQPSSGFAEDSITIPAAASIPPSIKVSIGRIDVRAIAPQPSAAKTSGFSTPRTSLDEYLKQHSGGKR